jgi:hypothetical protein
VSGKLGDGDVVHHRADLGAGGLDLRGLAFDGDGFGGAADLQGGVGQSDVTDGHFDVFDGGFLEAGGLDGDGVVTDGHFGEFEVAIFTGLRGARFGGGLKDGGDAGPRNRVRRKNLSRFPEFRRWFAPWLRSRRIKLGLRAETPGESPSRASTLLYSDSAQTEPPRPGLKHVLRREKTLP